MFICVVWFVTLVYTSYAFLLTRVWLRFYTYSIYAKIRTTEPCLVKTFQSLNLDKSVLHLSVASAHIMMARRIYNIVLDLIERDEFTTFNQRQYNAVSEWAA